MSNVAKFQRKKGRELDLFNTDPLKHLLPALEKLADCDFHELKHTGLPIWFTENLKSVWNSFDKYRQATNPINWFKVNGNFDPIAIKNYASVKRTSLLIAWRYMGETLLLPETQLALAKHWRIEKDRAAVIIDALITQMDELIETLFNDDAQSVDTAFPWGK